MTRPRKRFVVGGVATLPVAVFALQGGGVQVPTEAVWALALSAFGAYMIWLGRMTLNHAKKLTQVVTLLEGETGLVSQVKDLRAWKHDTNNKLTAAVNLAELHEKDIESLNTRVDGVHNRINEVHEELHHERGNDDRPQSA